MLTEEDKVPGSEAIGSSLLASNDVQDPEKGILAAGPDESVERPSLAHVRSHISTISQHDLHTAANEGYVEANASQYTRFSPHRKVLITIVCSVCSFLSPISSTTILSAIPEVAAEYNTSGSIINLSNALYLIFMGLSPAAYGPLSQVYGRRIVRTSMPVILDVTDCLRYAFPALHYSSFFPLALHLPPT